MCLPRNLVGVGLTGCAKGTKFRDMNTTAAPKLSHWTNKQLQMIMANRNVSAEGRQAAQRELASRTR